DLVYPALHPRLGRRAPGRGSDRRPAFEHAAPRALVISMRKKNSAILDCRAALASSLFSLPRDVLSPNMVTCHTPRGCPDVHRLEVFVVARPAPPALCRQPPEAWWRATSRPRRAGGGGSGWSAIARS